MIPKDKKSKQHLSEVRGKLFTAATQHLTQAVVKYKHLV
jgi:hypothetical protein